MNYVDRPAGQFEILIQLEVLTVDSVVLLPFHTQESTKEAVVCTRGNLGRLKEDLVDRFGGGYTRSLFKLNWLVPRLGRTNRRVVEPGDPCLFERISLLTKYIYYHANKTLKNIGRTCPNQHVLSWSRNWAHISVLYVDCLRSEKASPSSRLKAQSILPFWPHTHTHVFFFFDQMMGRRSQLPPHYMLQ